MEIYGLSTGELVAMVGAVGAVLGVMRRYRITPRSFLVWSAMVKNAETLRASAVYWEIEAARWQATAESCQSRLHSAGSNAGSGQEDSKPSVGPTP